MNPKQKQELLELIIKGNDPVCLHILGQDLVNALCDLVREYYTYFTITAETLEQLEEQLNRDLKEQLNRDRKLIRKKTK